MRAGVDTRVDTVAVPAPKEFMLDVHENSKQIKSFGLSLARNSTLSREQPW